MKKFTKTKNVGQVKSVAWYWESGAGFTEKTIPMDYGAQGGVVTEKDFVFSAYAKASGAHGGDDAVQYIVYANRRSKKIKKHIAGRFGHMNSFFYDWGTGDIRVSRSGTLGYCFTDKPFYDKREEKPAEDCKTKRAPNFRAQELTTQGRAKFGKLVYVAGWDAARDTFGQTKYKTKDSNAVFIYEKATKKLIRTLFISAGAKDDKGHTLRGEIEDVSIDGVNGDLYIFMSHHHSGYRDGKKGEAFYKISLTDQEIPGYSTLDDIKGVVEEAPEETAEEESAEEEVEDESVEEEAVLDGGGSLEEIDEDEPEDVLAEERAEAADAEVSRCGVNGVEVLILGAGTGTWTDDGGCLDVGGGEDGIYTVLNTVLEVLTFGVGTGATTGVVISGYTYMSAGVNEEKVRKSKMRLAQIVIGMVTYATMWTFLQWILPGGIFGDGS